MSDKYTMNNQKTDGTNNQTPERQPNEQAGFYFSGGVIIKDPQTGEVLVAKRTE